MICRRCSVDKVIEDFYPYRLTECKKCVIKKTGEDYRKRRKNNLKGDRLVRRDWHLRKTYGITNSDFDFLLVAQGDCCAICECPEPGGFGTWHIDHNHKTGNVRGLLCWPCNNRLGVLESKWAELAESYLADPPAKVVLGQ